jgi:two-component sensor histidine kinase
MIQLTKCGTWIRWILILAFFSLLSISCTQPQDVKVRSGKGDADRSAFFHYLQSGDSAYASKSSYQAFVVSLKYYDSAQAIADRSSDTLLLAEAIFAKGRVYDAWNKVPLKTVNHFKQAAALFAKLPAQYQRSLYVKHLIAHAYDKMMDTANAVVILHELYNEIAHKDTLLRKELSFIPEMALISTQVRDYLLADSILKYLTKRAWIHNDSNTLDYLDHYYLTQSRLDAFYRKPAHSFYLDSLRQVYEHSGNMMNRVYYSDNLSRLYASIGMYEEAYNYLTLTHRLQDSLSDQGDLGSMQNALLKSELQAEKGKTEYRAAMRTNRLRTIWVLSALLTVITILSIYLYRQGRKYHEQSIRLSALNEDMDDKVAQVELLNKEIQHRVKNNLHMIYSLLQMQERKTNNEETIENLQAARLRVESIAALHNQLLNNRGSLDFAGYLKGLIGTVVSCLSDEKKVITHISSDEISIPVNSYFALSLILNEWVTNSIKYAHTETNLLELNISIKNLENDVCIEYHDNGTVKPNESVTAGLGTQIIQLLTRQMSARLTTRNGNPYHYLICISHG